MEIHSKLIKNYGDDIDMLLVTLNQLGYKIDKDLLQEENVREHLLNNDITRVVCRPN